MRGSKLLKTLHYAYGFAEQMWMRNKLSQALNAQFVEDTLQQERDATNSNDRTCERLVSQERAGHNLL